MQVYFSLPPSCLSLALSTIPLSLSISSPSSLSPSPLPLCFPLSVPSLPLPLPVYFSLLLSLYLSPLSPLSLSLSSIPASLPSPKDEYPIPVADLLLDGGSRHVMLSFVSWMASLSLSPYIFLFFLFIVSFAAKREWSAIASKKLNLNLLYLLKFPKFE